MTSALAAPATASMTLPKEDSTFAALLLPPVKPARVQVLIHQGLSSQQLDQPIQFGLFAQQNFSVGDVLTPYGGMLRHRSDFGGASSKTHARSIGGGISLVLDGLPLANMLLRPTPHTAEELAKLVTAGMEPLLPTAARFSDADMQRFHNSPMGFMANTAPSASCNARVEFQQVRIADHTYRVPMLVAARAISSSEEILCPYRTGGSPSPPPPLADPRADTSGPALSSSIDAVSSSSSSAAASASARSPQSAALSSLFSLDYAAGLKHMAEYQWLLSPPNQARQELAQTWLQWSLQQEESKWELERGGWLQAVANVGDVPDSLYEASKKAGSLLLAYALGGAVAYDLKLVSQKLMKSPPGEGKQDEHFDAKTLQEAQGYYSVIIYFSAGDSTVLPTIPHDQAAEAVWFRNGPAAAAKLNEKLVMKSHHVEPGCALVLSHKVLHYGPLNTTSTDRITLFQHWGPQAAVKIPDSDVQRVPLGI